MPVVRCARVVASVSLCVSVLGKDAEGEDNGRTTRRASRTSCPRVGGCVAEAVWRQNASAERVHRGQDKRRVRTVAEEEIEEIKREPL